jgi:hypothetical protein
MHGGSDDQGKQHRYQHPAYDAVTMRSVSRKELPAGVQ